MNPPSALVPFAHGSRDPQWHHPLLAIAERARLCAPGLTVRCAYLELTEPDLPSTVQALAAEGVGHIRIVPMFLGVGRHAREDLPALVQALQTSHPQLQLELLSPVGEQQAIQLLMAQWAVDGLESINQP
ncbi:MAG: sirohydrochlorin chelatase [Limnohabitans sp.]